MVGQRHHAAFKQEVVEEFVRGDKRGAHIARERAIDDTTLRKWRLEYDQRASSTWLVQSGLSTPTPLRNYVSIRWQNSPFFSFSFRGR